MLGLFSPLQAGRTTLRVRAGVPFIASGEVITTDGTLTTIVDLQLPADTVLRLIILLAARRTDAAGSAWFMRSVTAKAVAGVAAINSNVAVVPDLTDGVITATHNAAAVGGSYVSRITGLAGQTIDWAITMYGIAT